MDVKSRTVPEFVVERAAKSVASAFVPVLSEVHAVVIRDRETRIRLRLNIVNPAAVVVVGKAKQRAELFICAETLTDRSGGLAHIASSDDRRVSPDS